MCVTLSHPRRPFQSRTALKPFRIKELWRSIFCQGPNRVRRKDSGVNGKAVAYRSQSVQLVQIARRFTKAQGVNTLPQNTRSWRESAGKPRYL